MLRKIEILRRPDDETGGGPAPAPAPEPSERERALEARLNSLQGKFDQMAQETTRSQHASQIAQAKATVDMAVTDAENAVNSAETALANALEGGEPVEIAKAQRAIAEASSAAERKRAERDQFTREVQEAEKRQGGQRNESATAAPQLNTSNLEDWKSRNAEWYGIDSDMTKISHEIDSGIRAAGTYTVGSKEYFQAIDRAMKQRFPDRFSGAPASAAARGDAPVNLNNPRRYDRDVQASMNAFGLSPEQWDNARKKAVEKGFLNETPARGRVMQ